MGELKDYLKKKDEEAFADFNISDEGKSAIKLHIRELIGLTVRAHKEVEGSQVKPLLIDFTFDNHWDDILEEVIAAVREEADKSQAHFTLVTSHMEDGELCRNWHISNDLNDCYRTARYQLNEDKEYKGKNPKFTIFDNWNHTTYTHQEVMAVIRAYRFSIFTDDGVCMVDEMFATYKQAETAFMENAIKKEEELKGNILHIADVRPNDIILKAEKITTLDGRVITLQINEDCDLSN